ncbi:MAG: flagellar hook-length control protein FliK [Gammaproteobacteria bacterium]
MMNINNPSFLTLLSAAAGSEAFNQQLNTEGTGAEGFAQLLWTEIGQLQNMGLQEQSPLPLQSLNKLSEESLQDLAALFGNKLPIADKLEQDINLEETLAALKEVLKHIDAVTASAQAPISGTNLLVAQGEQDRPSGEEMERLLQSVSDDRNDPFYAVLTPGVIEPVKEPVTGQETEAIQAGLEKKGHSLLQTLVKTDAQDDTSAQVARTSPGDTLTELPLEAAEKNKSFEQKLAAWTADKNQVNLSAEVTALSKQSNIEQKPEIPAMTRPFAHPDWHQELGERILWMNNKSMPFAELRLNPQHLGPVAIRIDMDQDRASIAFSAQQAAVREAIEAAVPKLREMLGAQQLNLAEVNVSQPAAFDQGKSPGFGQMAQQQQGHGDQAKGDGTGAFDHHSHLADLADDTDGVRAVVSNGLLNLFA